MARSRTGSSCSTSTSAIFFVADWHALTTGYEDTADLQGERHEVIIDWLAAGLNPSACTIFVQSRVPEHAELHLILSMVTPVSWLERVPTYKDQIEQLKDKDLSTYGFLGYPLLQSADILMYRPRIRAGRRGPGRARRDHARDRPPLQQYLRTRAGLRSPRRERGQAAWDAGTAASTTELRRKFQEHGDAEALARARALVESGNEPDGRGSRAASRLPRGRRPRDPAGAVRCS